MRLALDDNDGSLTDQIIETVDTPIVILGPNGSIKRFNPASQKLTGYASDEVLGRKVWEFLIIDEEIDGVRAVFEKTRGEDTPTHFTNYWKRKDGQHRLLEWSNKTIHDRSGKVSYVLATGVDITDAQATKLQLSETQAYLMSIIDASPIAIITINERGELQSFNRQAEECFGYKAAEVLGENVKLLMPEPDQSRHDQYMGQYMETGEKRIMERARSVLAKRRNGEQFPAMLHVSEFKDGQPTFVGFIEDITDQKMTERRLKETQFQLQHAGRVGAMGEIATSIAHELNQPLTAAASFAGAVSLKLKKAEYAGCEDAIELLDDVVSEIRRASEIIRQMREFIRNRKTAKSLHNVNQVVQEAATISLIGAESEGVKLETSLDDDLGELQLDRIQIQQVLVNLIRNAVDAMKDCDEKRLKISTAKRVGFVEITVEDTGAGISDEMKERLFEPFATNKEGGVGIGLSISKAIIDAHQGEIFANIRDSPGTVFTVKLPEGAYDEARNHR